MSDWPKYESHKVVHAAKIVGVLAHDDGGGVYRILVRPEGAEQSEEFWPTVDAMGQRAEAGAWAVTYEDGFRSISPGKAFEEGYRRLVDGEPTLREVVEECARQFRDYERQHLAKTPPDTVKAATNATFALMCEKALGR